MAVLSRAQLYQYAQGAGFTGAAADEVVAIALAESGGDTTHRNVNPNGSNNMGKVVQRAPLIVESSKSMTGGIRP
jgi:hypothetical protein